MSDFYLQDVHSFDDVWNFVDYEFSKDELDESLDEFLNLKPSKPSFFQ